MKDGKMDGRGRNVLGLRGRRAAAAAATAVRSRMGSAESAAGHTDVREVSCSTKQCVKAKNGPREAALRAVEVGPQITPGRTKLLQAPPRTFHMLMYIMAS